MPLSNKWLQGALLLGAAGLLSACVSEPARYTGGGTINSLGGAGRAQVSFTANGCDPKNVKGNVHYNDHTAIEYQDIGGVNFKAKVVNAGMCTYERTGRPIQLPDDFGGDPGCNTQYPAEVDPLLAECDAGQAFALFDYTSTNPKAPGAGKGLICVVTAGAGAGGSLHAIVSPIMIKTGPYKGYINRGSLVGNAMMHSCAASADNG